jgi:peptidoglycan hydrolase-like protein with peptidoglycan-binding domain
LGSGGGSYSSETPTYTAPYVPTITPASCVAAGSWTKKELMLVEKRLKAFGYDPGKIDGEFGPKAFTALRAFEKKRKLPASTESSGGYEIQRSTLRALGIKDC